MRPVTDLMWKALVDTADALRGWYSGLSIDPMAWGPFTWLIIAGVVLILLTLLLRPRRAWKRRPELLISHGEVVMRDPAGMPAVSLARSAPPHAAFELRMTVSNLGARPVQILELSIRTNRSSVPNTAEVGALVPPHGAVDVAAEVHEMEGDEGTIDLYLYAPDMRPKTFRLRARLRWEPWNVRFKLMPLQQRVEKTRDLASLRQNRREERRWRRRLAEGGGGSRDDVPVTLPVAHEEGRRNLTWEPAPQFVPSQETARPRNVASIEPSTTEGARPGPTAQQNERADAGRLPVETAEREPRSEPSSGPWSEPRPEPRSEPSSERRPGFRSGPSSESVPGLRSEPSSEPRHDQRPGPSSEPRPEPLREPSGEAERGAHPPRAGRPAQTLSASPAESVSRPADPIQGAPQPPLVRPQRSLVPPPSDEGQSADGKDGRVERSRVDLPAEPSQPDRPAEQPEPGLQSEGRGGRATPPVRETTPVRETPPASETSVASRSGNGREGPLEPQRPEGRVRPEKGASDQLADDGRVAPGREQRREGEVEPRGGEVDGPARPPSEGRTGAQLGQWRPGEVADRELPRRVRPTAALEALGEAARRLVRSPRSDPDPLGPSEQPGPAAEKMTDPHRSTWESAWAPQARDRASARRVGSGAPSGDGPAPSGDGLPAARDAVRRPRGAAARDDLPGPDRHGPARRDPDVQEPEREDRELHGPTGHGASRPKNHPQADDHEDERAGHRPPLEFPDDFS